MRELLARIDSRELTEWQAYARLEPFGERRADLRTAEIGWVMANLWRSKKDRLHKIEDFLLQTELDDDEQMTPEEMMRAFALATGAQR